MLYDEIIKETLVGQEGDNTEEGGVTTPGKGEEEKEADKEEDKEEEEEEEEEEDEDTKAE